MAAVGLYNMFYDGKAKTCTALLAASGFVNPVKPFKKAGQVFF